jgi:hypothetical protein
VQPWGLTGTTVVEGTANGVPFGRRTIKAWGKGADDWFIEFTAPFCKAASLSVGDRVALEFQIADASTPPELEKVLLRTKSVAAAWLALSDRERREAAEHVRAAKAPATRERRAVAIAERLRGKHGR